MRKLQNHTVQYEYEIKKLLSNFIYKNDQRILFKFCLGITHFIVIYKNRCHVHKTTDCRTTMQENNILTFGEMKRVI